VKEEWKDVIGYEDYYKVSNTGKVFSKRKNKLMTQFENDKGYLYVILSKNKKVKLMFVHRVVAMAFVNGYDKKLVVNHIDFNPQNNNFSNLEWITQAENVRYSASRMRHEKSVYKMTNTGEKYIRLYTRRNRKPCFRVMIKHKGICKQFKTFEEAVKYRNEVMKGA
jgi:hypothetical protein